MSQHEPVNAGLASDANAHQAADAHAPMSNSAAAGIGASADAVSGRASGQPVAGAASDAPVAGMQGALLSFLAGYADTVGFVGLGGLFTAHVTGNFVLLGYALVSPVQGILPKLLAFPVFVLGIAATRVLVARWQRQGKPALAYAMALQAVLLAASAAAAWLGGPITAPDAPQALACGMLCVAAMAAQNAYGKLLLSHLPATTVMTGNVTQLVIAMTDARGGNWPPATRHVLAGVLAFAAGACCGALLGHWSLPLAMLSACMPLLWLAWQAHRAR